MFISLKNCNFEIIEFNSIQKQKLYNLYLEKVQKEKYFYKISNTVLIVRNALNRYLSLSNMDIQSIGFDKIDEYVFIKFLFSVSQEDLVHTIKRCNFMYDFPINISSITDITRSLINFTLVHIANYYLVPDSYICELLLNEEKEEKI